MKKVWVLVTLIVCGAAIIFGNIHWKQKLSVQGEPTAAKVESVETVEETETTPRALVYAANLPEGVQAKIKTAIDSKEPIKLVIYGTTEVEGTWVDTFKKELTAAYGEDVFEVTAISTGNNTTREIVNEKMYEEINEISPDIVLFEAPMLKDNGNVGITNTLTNLEEMFESWQEETEGLVLMIQPSQPLYNATYYPSEVSQLEDFAKEKELIYLNHWTNWPELDNAEMLNYLNKDSEVNEKGFGVWADYLVGYFVAE